jgi:hypothetical protein
MGLFEKLNWTKFLIVVLLFFLQDVGIHINSISYEDMEMSMAKYLQVGGNGQDKT